ncbi:hypothetical protein [Maritalea porphyrae]|uniref:hypothetical protein n=1 Tax=Maritalea porphyrae TaxID=880732 RepID=UPI0022AFD5D5|nr:hypothetical protein [Maritalea porphyrae]MCZ4271451.1 hypothetical protein [Maritalea porphyrae]
MDVSAVISGISTSLTIVKTIKDIDKNFDAAQYKLQIAELIGNLAETKIAMVELADTLAAQEVEIDRLKQFAVDIDKLRKYGDNFYPNPNEQGLRQFPYCPHCIDKKSGFFQLHRDDGPRGNCSCRNCKSKFIAMNMI